mmetsp:Transcript_7902/g.19419  ORF Transcript_7902/g.19419 Transcript_7902/m.19419 type:complete len:632 (+) Transcript_7902:134-2029(+)
MVNSPLSTAYAKSNPSIAKAGGPKLKTKAGSGIAGRSGLPSTFKSSTITNTTKTTSSSTSKTGTGASSTNKAGSSAASRQVQSSATALEYNTPKQNQMLSHCDYADRAIWATRVLWGGNSVNGFLRATATAQRIKKQRARQNNSTKMSRAAKAASTTGMTKAEAPPKPGAPGTGSGPKAKEIFNQQEEELLKKEIMNPRTAKKLKSELEAGLTFCATVCNVLRGVLFDIDPSLSPSLPPHLVIEQEKPPPAHTFLIPSPPPPGSVPKLAAAGLRSTKGVKSKAAANQAIKGIKAGPKHVQAQAPAPSPGDAKSSTLRRLRKTSKKNKGQSIYSEPAFANLPPEFDPPSSNKRTCTKKEYQHRVFQLLRYRDLWEGDFCAARLSSRDLWILAKVLKDYKTNSQTPLYTVSPLEFLGLSDSRRDALLKEKVHLEDVEDQQAQAGTQVIRSLVLPLPRSPAEANEWASRLLKKGSRVYAMYPQTTSLYAATVTDSLTYCRGDDDIIVVQFDGEDADPFTGQFPSYHIPARFVILIPREFPASQIGRAAAGTKATSASSASTAVATNKRKSSTGSAGSSKRRQSAGSSGDAGFLDISMDFGAGGLGGFDDLDLDFDKPLDEHEQAAAQENKFSPF